MYLYNKLLSRAAAAVTEATIQQAREVQQRTHMVYNDSAIALAYGFTDYFDEESFGRVNSMLSDATKTAPSRLGHSSQLATATPFMVTMGVAAVLLRFFSRTRFGARIWWDDGFAVMTAVLVVAAQLIYMRIWYLGRATLDTMLQTTAAWQQERVSRIEAGLKLYMAFEVLYLTGSFLVKYSFLFLYLRISQEEKKIKWALRAAFVVTTVALIFCILTLFLTCIPLEDFWNIRNPNPQCERKALLNYGSGISNIVTETIVLAIPIPLLLKASLNRRQLRGVYILYLLGVLVIVASILRFVTQIVGVSMLQTMGWSTLEVSLALLLACAPMVARLLSVSLEPEGDYPILKPSDSYGRQDDFSSPFDKALPAPPRVLSLIRGNSLHVSRLGLNSRDKVDNLAQEDARTKRAALAKRGVLVKEMKSPMYKKLKLGTSAGADGTTVWEVQPLSATTATTTFSIPSRSPTISSVARSQLGGLGAPPGLSTDLLKRKEEFEEEERERERQREREKELEREEVGESSTARKQNHKRDSSIVRV